METNSTNLTEKPNAPFPADEPHAEIKSSILNDAHVAIDNLVNYLRSRLHPGIEVDEALVKLSEAKTVIHQTILSADPVLFGQSVQPVPDTPSSLPNQAREGLGTVRGPVEGTVAPDAQPEPADPKVISPLVPGGGDPLSTNTPDTPATRQVTQGVPAGKSVFNDPGPAKSPAVGNPAAPNKGPENESGK